MELLRSFLFLTFFQLNPADLVDRIISFGPRYCGPNILVNNAGDFRIPSIWSDVTGNSLPLDKSATTDFSPSLLTGFQLASLAGPLCEEPMMGVCFVLEQFTVTEKVQDELRKLSH